MIADRRPSEPVGDQSLPCLAKGETDVDGALMPVACDLWHGHDRRHWDETAFTFWDAAEATANEVIERG